VDERAGEGGNGGRACRVGEGEGEDGNGVEFERSVGGRGERVRGLPISIDGRRLVKDAEIGGGV